MPKLPVDSDPSRPDPTPPRRVSGLSRTEAGSDPTPHAAGKPDGKADAESSEGAAAPPTTPDDASGADPAPRPRRFRWTRRVGIAAATLFGLYLLVTMWAIPLTIRHWIVPSTSDRIEGTLEVGKVRLHPFRLSLRIDDLRLRDDDGELAAEWRRFRGTLALWRTITEPGWHFERVLLRLPTVRAERDTDASLNFARIFAGDPNAPTPQRELRRIPHVVIDDVAIEAGTIVWRDEALPEPFEVEIGGLTFRIDGLDTAPTNDNDFRLVAASDSGAQLRWEATFFADPFSSHGEVTIARVPLETLMPYAMRHTDARVTEGLLTIELAYDFAPARTPRAAVLDLRRITLDDFRSVRDGRPLAELPRVRLDGIVTDADARSLTVGRARIDGGALHVERDEEGVLNLVRMLLLAEATGRDDDTDTSDDAVVTSEDEAADARRADGTITPAERSAIEAIEYPIRQLIAAVGYLLEDVLGPWTLAIESIEVADQSIDLVDRTTAEPVKVTVRDLSLRAGPVRTVENYRVPFATAMRLAHGGTMALEGTLGAGDGDVDVGVRIDGVTLAPIAPYTWGLLPDPLREGRLRDGRVDLDGRLAGRWSGIADFAADWRGRAQVSSLFLTDAHGVPMLELSSAVADGTAASSYRTGVGSRAEFDGAAALEGVSAAPAFLTLLGLGDDAAARGDRLAYRGVVTATVADDGSTPMARAAGTAELRTLGASLPAMPLRTASLAALDAEFEFDGPLDRLADARIVGQASLVDVDIDAILPADDPGSEPIGAALRAGRATLDGEALVRVADGDRLALESSGAVAVTSLAARHRGDRFAAERLDGDGEATVELDGDAMRVVLSGLAAMTDGSAELPTRIDATVESIRLEGDAGIELSTNTSIDLDGTALAGAIRLATADESISAASLVATGSLWLGDGVGPRRPETISALDRIVGRFPEGVALPDGWRTVAGGTATLKEAGVARRTPNGSDGPRIETAELTLDGDAHAALGALGEWGALAVGTLSLTTLDGGGLIADDTVHADTVRANGIAAAHSNPTDSATGALELTAEGEFSLTGLDAARLDPSLDRVAMAAVRAAGRIAADDTGTVNATGTVEVDRLDATARDEAGVRHATLGSAAADGSVRLDGAHHRAIVAEGKVSLRTLASGRGAGGSSGGLSGDVDALQAEGSVALPLVADAPPMRVVADAFVEGVRLALPGAADASMSVESIRVDALRLDDAAGTLEADAIVVVEPSVTATVGLIPEEAAPTRERRTGADLADLLPYRVRVGTLDLGGGRIELFDAKDPTGTTMLVDELTVSVRELGTDGATMATVEAASRVQGSGRFRIEGTADPFRPRPEADLVVTLTGVPLSPFSALSGAYVGWRVDQGRATTNIPVRVTDGQVRGELGFTLDRVRLGERVRSPLAPSVPLDLGLSLLRDRNDRVTGRVPFRGDMADPRFSFTEIILQAFFGLIGQIVTAPFQLFASLFGGGDEDPSSIAFEPGLADPTPDGLERIGVIGRALEDRPGISLEIFGHYAVVPDGTALRPGLLREEVLRRLRTSFPNLTEVGDSLYRQVVISIHVERIGPPAANFDDTEAAVLETVEVPDELLRDLARRRAFAVLDALADDYGIDRARLTATAPSPDQIATEEPKVHLELF